MSLTNKDKQSEEAKKNMEAQEASVRAEKEAVEKEKADKIAADKAAAEKAEADKLAAEKAEADKLAADKAAAEKAEADKLAAEKAKKDSKLVKHAEELLVVMDRFKIDSIFENSKKELFTSENLAHISEGNNKKKVTSWSRNLLEAIVNTKKA